MNFVSLRFCAFFVAAVFVYYVLPRRARQPWLLACSCFFYMCWNPAYIVLILFSAFSTYLCGRALAVLGAPPGTGAGAGRPWPFRWRQIWEFCFSSNIIIFLRRVRTVCWLRGASPPYRCWVCSCLSASASTRFRRSVTLWTYTGAACPPSSAFGGICCLSPFFRSWWPGPLNAAAISFPNCSCLPVFPTSGPKAALC